MKTINQLSFPTTGAQAVLLLLAALRMMENEALGFRRADVLEVVRNRRLFRFTPEDYIPYPTSLTGEARWQTLLSFARLNAVEGGWVSNDEFGIWRPTMDGLNVVHHAKAFFLTGTWNVCDAYLWTSELKSYFNNRFEESWSTVDRSVIYEDQIKDAWQKSVRGSKHSRAVVSIDSWL